MPRCRFMCCCFFRYRTTVLKITWPSPVTPRVTPLSGTQRWTAMKCRWHFTLGSEVGTSPVGTSPIDTLGSHNTQTEDLWNRRIQNIFSSPAVWSYPTIPVGYIYQWFICMCRLDLFLNQLRYLYFLWISVQHWNSCTGAQNIHLPGFLFSCYKKSMVCYKRYKVNELFVSFRIWEAIMLAFLLALELLFGMGL